MLRKLFATLILTGFIGTTVMMAHDPSQHKGTPSKGEVISIAGDRMEVKTDKGVKTVVLNDKTSFERGKAKAAASDFKKGDRVAVLGTTLASGEIVAKEVLLDTGAPAAGQKHDSSHKH
jgi:ribosomal protein S1